MTTPLTPETEAGRTANAYANDWHRAMCQGNFVLEGPCDCGLTNAILAIEAEARERRERVDPDLGGEHCQTCGRSYPLGGWWHAPDDLWQRVTGQEEGLRCPDCFGREAEAKGITLVWVVNEYDRLAAKACRNARAALAPTSCESCNETHDIDWHDHHYHEQDATTYIGPAHLNRAAQDVHYDEGHTPTGWQGCATERCREVRDDIAELRALLAATEAATRDASPEPLDVERLAEAMYEACGSLFRNPDDATDYADAILARLADPTTPRPR